MGAFPAIKVLLAASESHHPARMRGWVLLVNELDIIRSASGQGAHWPGRGVVLESPSSRPRHHRTGVWCHGRQRLAPLRRAVRRALSRCKRAGPVATGRRTQCLAAALEGRRKMTASRQPAVAVESVRVGARGVGLGRVSWRRLCRVCCGSRAPQATCGRRSRCPITSRAPSRCATHSARKLRPSSARSVLGRPRPT